MAYLHSLTTTDLLAQAHHLSGLPSIKSNLLAQSPKPRKPPELSKSKLLGQPLPHPGPPFNAIAAARYKKAANHVHPIWTTCPKKYRILHHIPLLALPLLLKHPPDFTPSEKFTKEQREKMNINPSGFLWLEENKLVLFLIQNQEAAIAWDTSEHSNFRKDYFKPIVILTVKHIP